MNRVYSIVKITDDDQKKIVQTTDKCNLDILTFQYKAMAMEKDDVLVIMHHFEDEDLNALSLNETLYKLQIPFKYSNLNYNELKRKWTEICHPIFKTATAEKALNFMKPLVEEETKNLFNQCAKYLKIDKSAIS